MTRAGFMVGSTWDDHGLVGVARRLEGTGFENLSSADHVLPHVDGLLVCGVIGAATGLDQIGTNVVLAGLRLPAVVGRMLSTMTIRALSSGSHRSLMRPRNAMRQQAQGAVAISELQREAGPANMEISTCR
jgi:hypothetical protein